MPVTMTSEAFGKLPGETYTGPEEDWILAQGYGKRAGYDSSLPGDAPGVKQSGKTDVPPAKDLTLAPNREKPEDPLNPPEGQDPFGRSKPDYDYDASGVDNDPPTVADPDPTDVDTADAGIEPNTGPAVGNTTVTISGDDLKDVTGVTFGGTAGTALTKVSDEKITVKTPAHAAGAVNVVVTDPSGAKTVTNGFTYV